MRSSVLWRLRKGERTPVLSSSCTVLLPIEFGQLLMELEWNFGATLVLVRLYTGPFSWKSSWKCQHELVYMDDGRARLTRRECMGDMSEMRGSFPRGHMMVGHCVCRRPRYKWSWVVSGVERTEWGRDDLRGGWMSCHFGAWRLLKCVKMDRYGRFAIVDWKFAAWLVTSG